MLDSAIARLSYGRWKSYKSEKNVPDMNYEDERIAAIKPLLVSTNADSCKEDSVLESYMDRFTNCFTNVFKWFADMAEPFMKGPIQKIDEVTK